MNVLVGLTRVQDRAAGNFVSKKKKDSVRPMAADNPNRVPRKSVGALSLSLSLSLSLVLVLSLSLPWFLLFVISCMVVDVVFLFVVVLSLSSSFHDRILLTPSLPFSSSASTTPPGMHTKSGAIIVSRKDIPFKRK